MRYKNTPLHPGTTALAAVLVLSSTQLFAQSADAPPAVSAAPVLEVPPPVVSPSAATTAAPSPEAVQQPATAAAPSPVINVAPVVVNDDRPQAPRAAVAERTAKSVTAAKPAATTAAAKPAVSPAVPMASSLKPQAAAPAVAAPKATDTPVPSGTVATSQSAVQTQSGSAQDGDEGLLLTGVAAMAAVAVAGGALALRGRRRRSQEADAATAAPEVFAMQRAEAHAVERPQVAPAPVAVASAVTARKDMEGFDLSRYGHHVQAAYRGPTPENPSLSLKRRLKRARFYDQRSRLLASHPVSTEKMQSAAMAAEKQVAPSRPANRGEAPDRGQPRPSFRPAFQV